MKRLFIFALLFLASCQQDMNGKVWASTTASRQYNFVDDRNNSIPITASRMDAEFNNIITKLNQKVIVSASTPSSPIAGMLWFDSTNKLLKQYRNSEWVINGVVHVGSSAPSTPQAGDLWVNTGASYATKVYNGSTWATVTDLTAPGAIGSVTPSTASFTTLITSGNVGIGTSTVPNARLYIAGGNVGIGTSNPITVFQVNGTATATTFSGNTSGTHTGAVNLNSGAITNGTLGCTSSGEITITTDNVTRQVPSGCYVNGGRKQSDGNFTTLTYCCP